MSCRANTLGATLGSVFRYLLMLCDGQQHDPAVLVTAVPNFSVSEILLLPQGQRLRIRAIERQISARLIEAGISAVVVVERLDAEGRSASLPTARGSSS